MTRPAGNAHATNADIQLLLFVDRRPSSWEQMRHIRRYLENTEEHNFSLEVIDVSKQPYLAEYFKLIATPTLLKLYPEPRQMLAGSNLVAQLDRYWLRWQKLLHNTDSPSLNDPSLNIGEPPHQKDIDRLTSGVELNLEPPDPMGRSLAIASEVFELSDRIFQLEKEKRELEVRMKFKDRLMSVLAHDLRNPLTAISIALETLESLSLKKKLDDRPELAAQLFHHARSQSRQIERMISDILNASSASGDSFNIVPQELELGPLCQEVIAQQQKHIQRKQHRIQTDIPQDLPHAYADKDRVRQLLCNLVDNAIKYTPDGGTIAIAILHRTSEKLQISISDTGPGVPAETQTKIFEDRFRLNRDAATDGYGLGLALCQRIVRAHSGRIWVDAKPDCGSVFHFTLPVYRDVAGGDRA